MKKIVLLIDLYPPGIGGMETHAFEFAQFLAHQPYLDLRGVIAFTARAAYSENSIDFPILPHLLPEEALYDPEPLTRFLLKESFGAGDIVFFNSLYWIRVLAVLQERFPDTLFIQRSGGNDIVQAPIRGKGSTLRERRDFISETINRHLNLLLVTSEYSLKRISALGIHKKRMRAVVGGVDIKRFTPAVKNEKQALRVRFGLPIEAHIILGVSRLVPFKGIEYTLRALALLRERMGSERFHYVLVGSGPERANLQKLVSKLKLTAMVTFVGSIDPSKIHEYYRAADVFCHTPIRSRYSVEGGSYIHTESMGRCLMEASAAGIPILSTDVGGIREVVSDGINGVLMKDRDVMSIARALESFLTDPELSYRTGKKGREIAEDRFSWDLVFTTYLSLFNSL